MNSTTVGVADVLVALLVVEQPGREQQQRRPDALAAALRRGRLPIRSIVGIGRAEVEEQLLLDPRELVRDQVVGPPEARVVDAATELIGSS